MRIATCPKSRLFTSCSMNTRSCVGSACGIFRVSKKFPVNPDHPERVCWVCDVFCAAKDMRCGNGSDRTPHPAELFGEGWQDWGTPSEGEVGGAQFAQDNTVASAVLGKV